MLKTIEKAITWIGDRFIGLWLLAWVAFIVIWITPTNALENAIPARQEPMKKIALEWARLAPFPKEAKDFRIHTEGNSFSRTFKGDFVASREVLELWIKQSPGFQDAAVTTTAEGALRYIIAPGGGANSASVTINLKTGRVTFSVSSS